MRNEHMERHTNRDFLPADANLI